MNRNRPRRRLGRRYVLSAQIHRAKGCSGRRGEDLPPATKSRTRQLRFTQQRNPPSSSRRAGRRRFAMARPSHEALQIEKLGRDDLSAIALAKAEGLAHSGARPYRYNR
jgi:hypothetical protein